MEQILGIDLVQKGPCIYRTHIYFCWIGCAHKDTFSPPSAADSKSSLGMSLRKPEAYHQPITFQAVAAPKVLGAPSVTRRNLFKFCGKNYANDILVEALNQYTY